jgi:opine dehydrogenase
MNEKLNITIIGSGNGGTTIAADLSLKGHNVTLLKSSNKLNNEHFEKIQSNGGLIEIDYFGEKSIAKLQKVTSSFEEALTTDTQLVIIYVQTNYHESLIKKISNYLHDNQVILIEPGYLSTAYFLKYCHKDIIITEAESSPIDCRIVEPGKVKTLFQNVRNPIGVFPLDKMNEAKNILSKLDYPFTYVDSVVEVALNNPNLIVHTIGAIMSIPRIEYSQGDYWMYKEVFTPSIWNLVERLDKEKMDILEKLNLNVISYVDACRFRNSEDLSIDSRKVFFDYAQNGSPSGPTVSNSRYVTEDVSQGLVMLESLGKVLNIPTPICSSLINIASACLDIDFRKDGRTVETLGEGNINLILKGWGRGKI